MPGVVTLDAGQSAKAVRLALNELGSRLRERHPLLAHQDAIGATVFLVSAAAIVGNAVLYARGDVSVLWVLLSSAIWMSLLHELEHDLIHMLYFKSNAFVRNAMMAGVWIFRPSTIHPWLRRSLHLHHHKFSGDESDLEERAITLGERSGIRRTLMMADGMLAIFLRVPRFISSAKAFAREQAPHDVAARRRVRRAVRLGYTPLGNIHYLLWHGFIFVHAWAVASNVFGLPSPQLVLGPSALATVDFLVVVWLAPNVIRSFALNFVSSNIHYYGDIDPKNVLQQTQVWTSPITWPLQLFCFNFGGTHAIHHFVVRDPFYIRQLIASDAHVVMKKHGVRFNDFGTFARDNRWLSLTQGAPAFVTPGEAA